MSLNQNINQLVFLITSGPQSGQFLKRLTQEDFQYTQIDSSGGFLLEPSLCLLIGFDRDRLQHLLALIRKYFHPRRQFVTARADLSHVPGQPYMVEVEVGGAAVFAFDVERFVQL